MEGDTTKLAKLEELEQAEDRQDTLTMEEEQQERRRKRAKIEEMIEEHQQERRSILPALMPELWQYIFSYLDFEGVLAARAVSAEWNMLITGFRQAGVVGLKDNKPIVHILVTQAWAMEEPIDFSSEKLGKLTPATMPSFVFYQLMGDIKSLPQSFWPYLQGNNIHTLDLGGNEIGPEDAQMLAQYLAQSQVHTLYLYGNSIRAEGLKALAQCLAQTQQIHTLHLSYNNISAWMWKSLLEQYAHIKKWTFFDY